jgi:hypothetical protein
MIITKDNPERLVNRLINMKVNQKINIDIKGEGEAKDSSSTR